MRWLGGKDQQGLSDSASAVMGSETAVSETVESARISRRSLVAGSALLGGVVLVAATGAASAAATSTSVYYASSSGVTGVNDGSRDDGLLLSIAYANAQSVGANCLVLPVGIVYVNARIADINYPYDYVVRITSDDFTIVVPDGCTIVDLNTDNPGQRGCNDIFQFTGKRSGITGGGRFVHASPGLNGTTPNNYSTAVHLASQSDQCFITDLTADGLCSTTQGAFDNSSANRAYMERLTIRDCVKGVVQSSTMATVQAVISDIKVDGYSPVSGRGGYGIGINGSDVVLSGAIIINNQTYSGVLGTVAIAADDSSILDRLVAGGASIRITGPGGNISSQVGIALNGSNWKSTQTIEFGSVSISGMSNPVAMYGVQKNIYLNRLVIDNATFAIYRTPAQGANNTGDLVIDSVDVSNTYSVFYSSDANQTGRILLGSGTLALRSASPGKLFDWNTRSVYPRGSIKTIDADGRVGGIPLYNRLDMQRVASGIVAVVSGVDGLTTILQGTDATYLLPPLSPFDGQVWTLRSESAIPLFGFAGLVTVANAPSSLSAGYARSFIYSASAKAWI